MNRRLTFILLVVLIVAAGGTWLVERPKSGATPTPTPLVEPLWSLDSTQVTGVRIEETASKKAVELQRQADGNWQITSPSSEPADTGAVEQALAGISRTVPLTDLGEALDLAAFGMDKPTDLLTLKTADHTYAIEIGAKTVTGSGYYVALQGQKRVVVVDAYSLDGVLGFINQLPLPATATPEVSSTPEVQPTADPAPTTAESSSTATPSSAEATPTAGS